MAKRVIITGLGPVSALGLGIDDHWQAVCEGRSGLGEVTAFDASEFDCRIAGEVGEFKIRDYVPKTYRKATKVMARDIELAVVAADLAIREAGLTTKGIDPEAAPTYDSKRVACHIGAALIAADIDELTTALAESTDEEGNYDIHKWGEEGMNNLTPLWLLKYLPNMLACHVTIIHDTQGPSNTITCGEASGLLSVGESMRVIQRGAADLGLCGGADSRLNPMAYLRQAMSERLNPGANDDPTGAIHAMSQDAAGTTLSEGGAILVLESEETFKQRDNATGYARLVGFGASQTVHRASRNLTPDPEGKAIAAALRTALADAELEPDDIDLITPTGLGSPAWDQAELAAMKAVFGDRLKDKHLLLTKPYIGGINVGAGAVDLALTARAIREQKLPAVINCDRPLEPLNCKTSPARDAELGAAVVFNTGQGGQNAVAVLQKLED